MRTKEQFIFLEKLYSNDIFSKSYVCNLKTSNFEFVSLFVLRISNFIYTQDIGLSNKDSKEINLQ